MLRDLFSNRLFTGAFVFFVVIVVGGTLYIKYVERQTDNEFAATDERIKQFNEKPPMEAPVAEAQHSAAEKQSTLYQQRWEQYLKDHREWRAKQDEAFTEWMQAGEICLNIFPVPPEQYDEYIGGLSEAERQEIVAKLEVGLEKYQDASKKLTTFRKEEPVPPTTPQND